MGELEHEAFQFTFNGFLKVAFQESRVTVTVEQVERALFNFFQNQDGPTLKLKAGKVLLEHFDRKARTVAGNTESES